MATTMRISMIPNAIMALLEFDVLVKFPRSDRENDDEGERERDAKV